MTKLEVFDPPMCCSTGVCGPSVDPVLAKFAADFHWLAGQGVVMTMGKGGVGKTTVASALATVVGVLVEVPVMLTVCAACNRTRHWFAFAAPK